jgi:nitrogen fixation NifU-like protein
MSINTCKSCNVDDKEKMNTNLYKEEFLKHFKHSKYRKKISGSDFSSGRHNPSCGDSIAIEGRVEKDKDNVLRIIDLGFEGSGCVISQASASMLMEHCIGKSVDEILNMTKDDMLKMLGLELGPVRLKCALLSLSVLQAGLKELYD